MNNWLRDVIIYCNVAKLTMKMDVKGLIKVCLDAVDAHKRVPTTI